MSLRVRRVLVAAGLLAALVVTPAVWAVDVEELIGKAVAKDLDLKKAELGKRIAELDVAQSAASRGIRLGLNTPNTGLKLSTDLSAGAFALTTVFDPTLTLVMPDPANTSFSLGLPVTLTLPAGVFTPTLSAGVSQSLNSLIGAKKNTRVREIQESMSLVQALASVASRKAAIAQSVIGGVKSLIQLHLALRDMAETAIDLEEEAARTLALDAEGEKGAAYRSIAQRRLALAEKTRRSEREYAVRKGRLEKDLGMSLEDALPTVSTAELAPLPGEGDVEKSQSVRAAAKELELAEARFGQQSLTWLPNLSLGGSFGISGTTLPASVTLTLSWQLLDSGLRSLNREELQTQLELRRMSLEQARSSFASSLTDLELDAMSLANAAADAERALEGAREELDEARALLAKGLRTERDVGKAAYAVEKRGIELRVSELERLAFRYRVQALTPAE